ncbi:zinc finger domain-containing protein [Saguinus oedipus]|uniref:Zinc finger domain-containing protein n=1 Tax=Saguinus oedipus TaxID=9490 RepID=A0ABQ9TG18_SAGOE|nr:zinc finger domain-containing protein [Saguinus oedipus]
MEAMAAPMEAGAPPVEVEASSVEVGASPMEAGASPMEAGSPPVEAGAASMENTQELERIILQLLGDGEQESYTCWEKSEGNLRSSETATSYFSETMKPRSPALPEPLTVQLPASFTYSYSSPLSTFSGISTISPPSVTAPVSPQMHSNWGPFDFSLWSDVGGHRLDPQEHPRDKKDSEPHQQRRLPVYRRPGDWDCPWCKAVNFSQRDICSHCGRGIWLQNPQ